MRIAVTQFATSLNSQENLATCIRMIDEASVCEPALIVLPEYCNTLPWYVDHNQAWENALAENGRFLQGIAEQAKKFQCYIVLGVTLRRDLIRKHQDGQIKSNISVTSCLFSPQGELIQQVDKQTLIGHENDFFTRACEKSDVVTTPLAKLGLLSGSDIITFDAAREHALAGAQLLCHSTSSFALDQSHLHGPARACENKIFFASANKVGALVPQQQNSVIASPSLIAEEHLVGTGHSQIVSPNGKVLARMANNDEGFVFADINLAESTHKLRADGTDIIEQRRPELYLQKAVTIKQLANAELDSSVPETANVAIFATYKSNEQAIEDVCHYIENNLSDIIQLPELFFLSDKTLTQDPQQLVAIESLCQQLVSQVSAMLRPFQYVCTSLVLEGVHQAVLISENGILARQQQLHFCQRYQWTALGDEINIVELALEQGNIKLAMLTADDANVPELVNVVAANGIQLMLVPFDIQEPCEVEYSLLSRAAENRICIVAATREKSFASDLSFANRNDNNKNKVKSHKSTGLIANLNKNFDLLNPWGTIKLDDYINKPLVKNQHGKITKALVYPIAACNKYFND